VFGCGGLRPHCFRDRLDTVSEVRQRTERINVRLLPKEKAAIEAAATWAKMLPATYMREVVLWSALWSTATTHTDIKDAFRHMADLDPAQISASDGRGGESQ
jgi:hypothetical protein